MEWEQLIYVWVSKRENTRFNEALKENGDDAESLMRAWISDYVEMNEDDVAAKRLYENNPVARRKHEEDKVAKKLHAYADKMGK